MGSDNSKPTESDKPTTSPSNQTSEASAFTNLEEVAGVESEPVGGVASEPYPVPLEPESRDGGESEGTHQDETPKMTAMAGLEEQLREMLQCKICYDDKEKQKLLPCQHTICLDCLNRLEIRNSKYKCPLCNKEMLVPNGGFESLQESLITKQLAHLIQKKPGDAAAAPRPAPRPGTSSQPSMPATSPVKNTELTRKMQDNIAKGKETLVQTRSKTESYQITLDELETTADRMKTSINNLIEQTIQRLMDNAAKKIAAIDELTTKKKDELLRLIIMLTDTHEKTKRNIDLLERRLSAPVTLQPAVVNADLQTTQKSVADLEELLGTLDTVGGTFRAGDSVRLKMQEAMMDSEFLLSDLNHFSVGYIHTVDDDGDCAVLFPENSRWTGNITSLEKSATQHNLPVIGDRVRVKASVKTPHFKWGVVKQGSIGILTTMKNTGPSKGRQVEVDFPEDHDWTALYDELEKVPPIPLKVGDEVWIAQGVSEPARGWAGVTPVSRGKLLQVNGDEVKVKFPECDNWGGLLSEIEKTRPIICGDKVKVKASVTEPKFAWGGVDHDDVGTVAKIMNSAEHGQVVKVNFPNRLGLWQCLLAEIEIVTRHSGGDESSQRRSISDLERCATQ